jgi:hypothetical protein
MPSLVTDLPRDVGLEPPKDGNLRDSASVANIRPCADDRDLRLLDWYPHPSGLGLRAALATTPCGHRATVVSHATACCQLQGTHRSAAAAEANRAASTASHFPLVKEQADIASTRVDAVDPLAMTKSDLAEQTLPVINTHRQITVRVLIALAVLDVVVLLGRWTVGASRRSRAKVEARSRGIVEPAG